MHLQSSMSLGPVQGHSMGQAMGLRHLLSQASLNKPASVLLEAVWKQSSLGKTACLTVLQPGVTLIMLAPALQAVLAQGAL